MIKLHAHEAPLQDRARTGWLDKYVEEYERDADYMAEGLALRLLEQAITIMAEKGISRSDLASLLGATRAQVTRMFNAPPNLTLRSIARLARALGAKAEVNFAVPSSAAAREAAAAGGEAGQAASGSPGVRTTEGEHPVPERKRKNRAVVKKRPVHVFRVDEEDLKATVEYPEPVALTSEELSFAEGVLALFLSKLYGSLLSSQSGSPYELDSLYRALHEHTETSVYPLVADLYARGYLKASESESEGKS